MYVKNMTSRNGNKVANQFVITEKGKTYFQSYDAIIAVMNWSGLDETYKGKITLDESFWDYSKTTGKYRNDFLGEGISETRKKIASGEYKLANLNE